jgi:lysophospholipase L1-like esterase
MGTRRLAVIAGAVALVLAGAGFGLALALSGSGSPAGDGWVASWAASPMAGASSANTTPGLSHQTVRNIIDTSAGGDSVRVQVSNAFGAAPLAVGNGSVGEVLRGARLAPGTSHALSFGGKASVTIPAHGQVVSDPLAMPVRPVAELAVSLYLPGVTGPATNHSDAQQDSYIADGDHAGDTAATAYTKITTSWLFVDELDVHSATADGTIVAFGDSITDGYQSTIGANARWPNYLARRLAGLLGDRAPGVVDEGISGNRVLQPSSCYGVSAQARFQRDALSQPGVKAVIVLEGINDISFVAADAACFEPNPPVTAAQIEAGYQALVTMAHAQGVKVYFATLTPIGGSAISYDGSPYEAQRDEINTWIRTSSGFDGMIDSARAVQDPRHPLDLNPAYDSGDRVHPNDRGYAALANAVPLDFVR